MSYFVFFYNNSIIGFLGEKGLFYYWIVYYNCGFWNICVLCYKKSKLILVFLVYFINDKLLSLFCNDEVYCGF